MDFESLRLIRNSMENSRRTFVLLIRIQARTNSQLTNFRHQFNLFDLLVLFLERHQLNYTLHLQTLSRK